MAKVVLITGASSGIGKVTAEYLVRQGYRVFGTSRRADVPGDGFTMLPLDVRSAESIQACVQAVIAQAGRIDVLMNNAGLDGPCAASEEISMEQIQRLFEVNVFGVMQMVNAVMPHMRAQGDGKIINVSSIAGYVAAPPFFSAYCASKHALEGYTESLRYEARLFNIHVSLVEPGYMRTNIGASCEAPAHPIDDYEAARRRVYETDMSAIQHGRDPVLVAKTAAKIIAAKSPALRYPVSDDATLMALVKRLIPFWLIEWFFGWLFLRGTWSSNNPGMLRRLFLDTAFSDKVTRYGMATLVVLIVGVVGLRLATGG